MRTIREHELRETVPLADVAKYLDAINKACVRFDISTSARQAAFIANCAVESASFRTTQENLNYTNEESVLKLFRKHWDALDIDDAWGYLRQPERLANRVYAGRMGNGDEASGDGWKYRGRGLIQVTGKDNYRMCGSALGLDLLGDPDKLLEPDYACSSAGWFWRMKGLNALADKGDFEAICSRVNGTTPAHGLHERIEFYEQALKAFA